MDTLDTAMSAVSEEDSLKKEEPKPVYQLQVAKDNMTVYLRVKPAYAGQKITPEQICDYLKENEVVYGLCDDAIRIFCSEEKFYLELICAQGTPPVDGVDGWIDFKFDTDNGLKPREREDGTVDFRDLGLVKNISKGETLCRIVPPEPGRDGTDVYGNTVHFRQGKFPSLPLGNNTSVSDDQLSLFADVDGSIEYINGRVNVNDVFIIRGNVDGSSGNISAAGSVIVQGDVREGFFVKSEKDISIRGMAEGAMIEAKGNISISNGMNGMGKGTLKAGGDIVGKYFENAKLIAGRNICADVLMNSQAKAGDSIILKGRKASLISGIYEAENRIYAKNIGTAGNIATRVSIQSTSVSSFLSVDQDSKSIEELNALLAQAENRLNEYQEKFSELTKQITLNGQKNSEQGNRLIKSAIFEKGRLTEAVNQIKKQIKEAQEKNQSLMDFNITGTGIVYPGTRMTIGPFTLNVQTESSNVKFYANQERIVFGPVLPSDMV
jgi:Predicted polymerase, most proteins contain PALM domain, HD hydrolase domain and Zn-ribbon domain